MEIDHMACRLLSRRAFLKQLMASGFILTSSSVVADITAKDESSNKQTVFYSAAMNSAGQYVVAAISATGKLLFETRLPARAHAVAMHPSKNELLVFARRPRHFLLVLNAKTGKVIHQLQSAANRPLYGHGVFSHNGTRLYLTANDTDNRGGVISVRDTTDSYRQVNEFSSGGIGPHELKLLRDGKTLVVANGGILTHPESGRSKLNLDSMTPALTYLDVEQGKVLDDFRLDSQYHQLSIRHLDVNQQDTVCFAMQYQGSRHDRFPLIGFHRQGQTKLQLATTPKTVLATMKNYCGSVCADASGKTFAVSSPKGNVITLWCEQGKFIASQSLSDGCGVAAGSEANSFYLSSGLGEFHHYQSVKKQDALLALFKHYRWDNHLLSHILS